MPAGAQGDPRSGAPAAGQLIATLRRKPLTPRRAALIIAGYTVVVTFAGGLVAWLTDRKDFHSLGTGLWWALQTITTVGYAAVTAALIEAARRRVPPARDREELSDFMREVTARLSAIEARLDELGPRAGK